MRFPPDQALRSTSQQHQDRDHRAGASADCCGGTCANRAPAAASRWCRGNRSGDPSVPVLRRAHEHHRDLQARLDTASPADRSNHRRQDRYVLITLKRRTHNLAQRRLLTGADHARANAPSRQLRIPATDTLNNSLNHKPELSLPASRLEAHGTPALAPSASAKSP